MYGSPSAFVRYGERVFPARITSSSRANPPGEWRYGWVQQAFDPVTGQYADAQPALQGTPGDNHATELRGRYVADDTLVWMRLKGSVGQAQVYEFCEGGGHSASTFGQTVTGGTTAALVVPPGVTTYRITPTADLTIQGVRLPDGQSSVTIVNGSPTYSITVLHESGSAAASERVRVPGALPVELAQDDALTLLDVPDAGRLLVVQTTSPVARPATAVTSGTAVNALDLPRWADAVILTPTADVDFTGFSTLVPGKRVTVRNPDDSGHTFTVVHDSAGSPDGKLRTPTGLSVPVPPGFAVDFVGGSTAWVLEQPLPGLPWRPSLTTTQNDLPVPPGAIVFAPALPSAAVTITGLADLPPWMPLTIVNPGTNGYDLTLSHANSGSTAANRFDLSGGASVTLSPGESLTVVNDGNRVVDVASSVSKPAGSGVSGSGAAGNVTKFAVAANTIEASTIAEGTTYAGTVAREWVTSVVWVVGSGGSLTAPGSGNGFDLSAPTSSTALMNVRDAGGTIQATLTVRHVSGEARVELDGLGDPAKFYANGVEVGGGGTGTVTSVGLTVPSGLSVSGSPVTSSGTLAVTVSDAAAFRTAIGAGTGSGTVTSVGLTMPSGFTVTGSPVTSSGTLAVSITGNISMGNYRITDLADPEDDGDAASMVWVSSNYQPADADLTAVASLSGTGVACRTGAGTWQTRTITAGANISVTNGDGVSGNPTVAVTGLAAVATSGSAADLGAGILPAARMPAHTGDVTSSAGSVALTIAANAVTSAKFRQSAGLSVVARSTNSTGDVADVTAGTDHHVLRRSGTTLGFGLLTNNNIDASAAIAISKLATQSANTILANATGSTAAPTAVAVSASRLVGRTAAGNLAGLTITEALDIVGSAANGDILIRSGGTWTRLAIGTNGRRLRVASALPSWVIDSGRVLNRSSVATAEATTSTTPVGLTTAQSFTIVPDESWVVQIEAEAACVLDTTNASARLFVFDGTTNHEVSIATVAVATGAVQLRGSLIQTISSSTTYTLRFSVTSGSGTFSARLLKASIIA